VRRFRVRPRAICTKLLESPPNSVVFQWTVPYMINADAANLGVKAIYVWAGLLVPTTAILYFFYPETAGRTYWELDELYERKISARKFKSTPTLAEQAGRKNKALVSKQSAEQAGLRV